METQRSHQKQKENEGNLVLTCPTCRSVFLCKDGSRYLSDGSSVQRWLCKNCAHRFSGPPNKPKSLRIFTNKAGNGKYAELYPKNLLKAVTALSGNSLEINNGPAGATQLSETESNGKMIEHAWWMKKQGFSENTITRRVKLLKTLGQERCPAPLTRVSQRDHCRTRKMEPKDKRTRS